MDEPTCAVRLTRRFPATPAEVWAALTDADSRPRWLGPIDATLRTVDAGRVLELDLGDSVARIELREEEGGTVLVLDHAGISAPGGMRTMRRWTQALAALEERL